MTVVDRGRFLLVLVAGSCRVSVLLRLAFGNNDLGLALGRLARVRLLERAPQDIMRVRLLGHARAHRPAQRSSEVHHSPSRVRHRSAPRMNGSIPWLPWT